MVGGPADPPTFDAGPSCMGLSFSQLCVWPRTPNFTRFIYPSVWGLSQSKLDMCVLSGADQTNSRNSKTLVGRGNYLTALPSPQEVLLGCVLWGKIGKLQIWGHYSLKNNQQPWLISWPSIPKHSLFLGSVSGTPIAVVTSRHCPVYSQFWKRCSLSNFAFYFVARPPVQGGGRIG